MDYRGNSVAKFSGGFADPLLKFRWIIRRTHTQRQKEPRLSASEEEDNESDDDDVDNDDDENDEDYAAPSCLQISYLLYLTGDGVFLKELTMRDGGSLSTSATLPRASPRPSPLRKCLMPRKVRRGN